MVGEPGGKDWGVNEAGAYRLHVSDDTLFIDRPTPMADDAQALPAASPFFCRFARDADARLAAQLLRGYQAALEAGE